MKRAGCRHSRLGPQQQVCGWLPDAQAVVLATLSIPVHWFLLPYSLEKHIVGFMEASVAVPGVAWPRDVLSAMWVCIGAGD